jgi:hypothetical protein
VYAAVEVNSFFRNDLMSVSEFDAVSKILRFIIMLQSILDAILVCMHRFPLKRESNLI